MLLTILLLILFIAPISHLLHESGHVLLARFFQAEMAEIRIGTGRKMGTFQICQVPFQIHAIYFHHAYSVYEKTPDFSKKQKAIISIGGPVMNAGIASVIFLGPFQDSSWTWTVAGWYNVYIAVVNVIPFKRNGRKSDGYHFIQNLTS